MEVGVRPWPWRQVTASAAGLLLAVAAASCGDDDTAGDASSATSTPGLASSASSPVDSSTTLPDSTESPAASGSSDTSGSPGSPVGTGPAAGRGDVDADAFPVTIEHKYGSTTIEEPPQRVVSVGYNDHDTLLALGVQPVAARWWHGPEDDITRTWADEYVTGDDPEILNMPELNVEAVANYRPDLIVGLYSGMTAKEYESLSQIAPTLATSGDYVDYGMPWQEVTRTIGAAVGRSDLAERLIADLEARFAEVRDAHPEWEGKTAVVATYATGERSDIGFFASEDQRARFMAELGFETPAALDDIAGDRFYGELSFERAATIDEDLIVWDQVSFTDGGRQAIEGDPLIAGLQAMQDGRYVVLEGDLESAFAWNTVLSMPYAIDAIVPLLEQALPAE